MTPFLIVDSCHRANCSDPVPSGESEVLPQGSLFLVFADSLDREVIPQKIPTLNCNIVNLTSFFPSNPLEFSKIVSVLRACEVANFLMYDTLLEMPKVNPHSQKSIQRFFK